MVCSCARHWLQVVLSSSVAPGEGEHKMIDFIRRSRQFCGPAEQRHCLYGADADLVLLALATRERNIMILREVRGSSVLILVS